MSKFQLELAKAIEELALDKGIKVNELLEVALKIPKDKEEHKNETRV